MDQPLQFHNRLLANLSPADQIQLRPHLDLIDMPVRESMEEPNKPIGHAYFMEAGIASVVAVGKTGSRIEIGVIGREGMTGVAVVMGSDRSPHSTYMQVGGRAQRISAADLIAAMEGSTTLRGSLLKFAQAFMVQTAHTAVANGRASVEQRLARWLLMAHDRLDGDELPLTHEFISLMLGVRRAGVTVALHALSQQALIHQARGTIHIVDREGLELVAGPYYGVPEAELQRLMQ